MPKSLSDRSENNESGRWFRTIFEQVAVGIALIDSYTGRFLKINQKYSDLIGYTNAEMTTKTFMEVTYPDDLQPDLDQMEELRQGKIREFSMEKRLICKDGSLTWVKLTVSPTWNPGEPPRHHIAVVENIAGHKQAEQALQESESRYRTLVENAAEAIVVFDVEANRFVDFNKNALRLFKLNAERLLQLGPLELSPPQQPGGEQSARSALAAIEQALAGQTPIFEWVHRDADGRDIACEVRLVGLPHPDRKLVRGSVTDITDRKRAEQNLRESESKFRALSERSPAMVSILRAGRFYYCNPATVALTGYSFEELQQIGIRDIIHPDYTEEVMDRHMRRLNGEPVPSRYEFKFVTKGGEERWADISADVIEYQGGPAILAICVDVTDRKFAEQQLRLREAQLAHVARLSTMGEMVAGIAHEVNQPLYSILNFAKATEKAVGGEGPINREEIAHWNKEISNAATRAGQIIKRLRQFVSRNPSERSSLRLNDIVRESLELVQYEANRVNVSVHMTLPRTSPIVCADRVQIQQVLVNLLINAFEALQQARSKVREVTIDVRKQGEFLEVSVSDTGPGLPADATLNLFEAFVTTKAEGMGLGLAISTTIVESHGGRLWATSNPQGGATFQFTLTSESKAAGHVS